MTTEQHDEDRWQKVLDHDELDVVFQPKLELATGVVVGAGAATVNENAPSRT